MQKLGCFFKTVLFLDFDRSRLFFNQSKLIQNFLVSLYLFRSIEPKVSINRKSHETFFKTKFSDESNTFSKSFLTFLSPYDSIKAHLQFFLVFNHSFCKVFFSQGRYVRFTLPFAFYFMFSCVNSWFLGKFSNLCKFRIFVVQAKFSEIDQWVFVIGCCELDLAGLIWSIWWILRNWYF